ncbi:hypothetical protein BDV33DRAFT_209882 [Aspergillus novoparasiticus]|uniref:GS catalytic domain-containing protein n=1 Tax=Aspergillus novoparasiticus TaxID=986946 RepID=A0A5N6E8X9_9EURO|nr:hypothetical protein BDV33DRAFT_209882 [Aspergillus novoparasiticus]
MSLNPVTQATQLLSDAFFGWAITHLPSILAFCMPQVASYGRVAADCRACGVYATWGWYNKETSLQRMRDNRFEIRVMDGLANLYLALGSILAAGILGIQTRAPLGTGVANGKGRLQELIKFFPRHLKRA